MDEFLEAANEGAAAIDFYGFDGVDLYALGTYHYTPEAVEAFKNSGGGGTPTEAVLQFVEQELKRRTGAVLVVTDGAANNPAEVGVSCERLRKEGIGVYGLSQGEVLSLQQMDYQFGPNQWRHFKGDKSPAAQLAQALRNLQPPQLRVMRKG